MRRLHGAPRHDEGSALMLVLGMMTAIAVFASVALTYATQTLAVVDRSGDNQQALSAAEAGVADYLARLNKDENYWRAPDCANQALKGPEASGCAKASAPGWLPVPDEPRSKFHYDVGTTTTYSRGTIVLTSTGKTGKSTRTVQVNLRRGGFGEFLYYTDYETVDPANEVVYYNTTNAQKECPRYAWANPTRPPAQVVSGDSLRRVKGCPDINFTAGDVIKGPLHSNDTIVMTGTPTFEGSVTTSRPSCRAVDGVAPPVTSCYDVNGSASPKFVRGIAYRDRIELNDSITDLRKYVTPGSPELRGPAGCLYTGPTRIRFLPTTGSAPAQMRVWSNWTEAAQLNPGCGTTSTLRSADGALLDVPDERLIYVQDKPSGQKNPSTDACKASGAIGDKLPANPGNNLYEGTMYLAESDCTFGTAYVEGTLKGRVTLTTDNNIIVTGDLKYAGGETGTDALGLIAKNSVQVYHPMKVNCTNSSCSQYTVSEIPLPSGTSRPSGSKFTNPQIYAAIQTLQHSFGVQVYSEGTNLGTLKVFGTIAQRYRGPVGQTRTENNQTTITGYSAKNYVYDTRLRYAPPPYFLDPVRSGWGQKTFGEVQARY